MSTVSVSAANKNLALHKKLDYSIKPSFQLTVDPRDEYLLTDGVIGKSAWGSRDHDKTVGWGWIKKSPLEIIIDLESIESVSTVNVYTVGGGKSEVEYPEYIVAMTSLDGKKYAFANLTTGDGLVFGAGTAEPKTMELRIDQRTRYIKLLVRPMGQFFFTDEIEVIQASRNDLSFPSKYQSKDQLLPLVERTRQLQRDYAILKNKFCAADNKTEFDNIETSIETLTNGSNIDNVSSVESEFAKFRAALFKELYNTDWFCFPDDTVNILRFGNVPKKTPSQASLNLYQWQNEYSAAAFDIVNCTPEKMLFKMHLSPVKCDSKEISASDIIELRRALYVRVVNAGLVADPLVLQNSEPFTVKPGQVVQIWLEADSHGLNEGKYTATLAVEVISDTVQNKLQSIQINIEVADKVFPDKLPFKYCNWDFLNLHTFFTGKNFKIAQHAAKDLDNSYTNVTVIRYNNIYSGHGFEDFSPQQMDTEIELRENAKPFYLLMLGVASRQQKQNMKLRSDSWRTQFESELTQIRDFMLNKGINYDRFALYPFDEYIGEDYIYVAQIIRDFDPRLKIYADNWIEPGDFNKLKGFIDIWCPHIFDVFNNRQRFDKYCASDEFDYVWSYCAFFSAEKYFAPEQLAISRRWRQDNEPFWRTYPMIAAALGTTGAGFWVYQDSNQTTWDKDGLDSYSVIYNGKYSPDTECIPEPVVPSKRWRLWRQGIEDAVCLKDNEKLLEEFDQKPSFFLNDEYLATLRKRADDVSDKN